MELKRWFFFSTALKQLCSDYPIFFNLFWMILPLLGTIGDLILSSCLKIVRSVYSYIKQPLVIVIYYLSLCGYPQFASIFIRILYLYSREILTTILLFFLFLWNFDNQVYSGFGSVSSFSCLWKICIK